MLQTSMYSVMQNIFLAVFTGSGQADSRECPTEGEIRAIKWTKHSLKISPRRHTQKHDRIYTGANGRTKHSEGHWGVAKDPKGLETQ